jgi:hypothetical protein
MMMMDDDDDDDDDDKARLANLGCGRPLGRVKRRNIQPRMPVLEVTQGRIKSPSLISCETVVAHGGERTRGWSSAAQRCT